LGGILKGDKNRRSKGKAKRKENVKGGVEFIKDCRREANVPGGGDY